MGELSRMPNIGPVVESQLEEAGITTAEQLRAVGSREAWLRIQQSDPSACIHRLQGLEAAIQNIPKKALAPETKKELLDFYRQHKL